MNTPEPTPTLPSLGTILASQVEDLLTYCDIADEVAATYRTSAFISTETVRSYFTGADPAAGTTALEV